MKHILPIIIELALMAAHLFAQDQSGFSGGCYAGMVPVSQPRPTVSTYWSHEGASRYGMDIREAKQFKAELTSKALVALISKQSNFDPIQPIHQQQMARHAMQIAHRTCIEMGLLYEEVEDVKPAPERKEELK